MRWLTKKCYDDLKCVNNCTIRGRMQMGGKQVSKVDFNFIFARHNNNSSCFKPPVLINLDDMNECNLEDKLVKAKL